MDMISPSLCSENKCISTVVLCEKGLLREQIPNQIVDGFLNENQMDVDVVLNNKCNEPLIRKLTINELKSISLGSYQLNMGTLCNEAHYTEDMDIYFIINVKRPV